MISTETFPLRGVIGVVANSVSELELAAKNQLLCVEIRADLLLDRGLSKQDLMSCIAQSKTMGLACLVTLRHPSQGGKFEGSEAQRIEINQQALAAGADIIDLESGTEAAAELLRQKAPMILSYHDFNSMPTDAELAELTQQMTSQSPLAIKVVPTASSLQDAVAMLRWVSEADNNGIKRIGFAMGQSGACSRILTTACGAPVTYTSFGDAVAPGQIALDALLNTYRVMSMDQQTSVVAVTGSETDCNRAVKDLNQQFSDSGANQVAIGFAEQTPEELEPYAHTLKITAIHSA